MLAFIPPVPTLIETSAHKCCIQMGWYGVKQAFTAQLKEVGFTIEQLMEAGFDNAKELKRAGCSAADLEESGFTATELKEASCICQ